MIIDNMSFDLMEQIKDRYEVAEVLEIIADQLDWDDITYLITDKELWHLFTDEEDEEETLPELI